MVACAVLSTTGEALRVVNASVAPSLGAKCGIKIPDQLKDVGLQVFGSQAKLDAAAANILQPRDATLVAQMKFKLSAACDDYIAKGGNVAVLEKESVDDGYGFKLMDPNTGGVFVDIGGNIGDTALVMARRFPKAQIIVFEPIPITYFTLRLNLFHNDVTILTEDDIGKKARPGVLPLNMVIGNKDVTLTWNPSQTQAAQVNNDTKKFDLNKAAASDKLESATVKAMQLSKFLRDRHALPVSMVKMDCEGCEFSVVPQIEDIIADKKQVLRFSGEAHWVAAPSEEAKQALKSVLKKRDAKCLEQAVAHVPDNGEFTC